LQNYQARINAIESAKDSVSNVLQQHRAIADRYIEQLEFLTPADKAKYDHTIRQIQLAQESMNNLQATLTELNNAQIKMTSIFESPSMSAYGGNWQQGTVSAANPNWTDIGSFNASDYFGNSDYVMDSAGRLLP
jgi:hypothetical protein